MTLDIHGGGPREFELDDERYSLLDLGGGQVRWDSVGVPGQPGDSTQVKSAPLEMHGGYGATHRIRRGNGTPSDPTHHAYCFPGGTLVSAVAGVQSVFRRRYSGDLVEVVTTKGHHLTGTPNHAVLTQRGWVPLGFIHEGDCVFSGDARKVTGTVDPNNEHRYLPIEEVFELASPVGASPRRIVVPLHLNGDGFEPEIDVVAVDGFLRGRIMSEFLQPIHQFALARSSGLSGRALLATGNGVPLFGRESLPPRCGVGVGEPDFALFGVQPGPVSLRSHGRYPAPVLGRERRLPKDGGLAVRASNATAFEHVADSMVRYAEGVGDVLRGFAGEVSPDRIVRVERVPYSGHVYDLQTETGNYYAENIVVHNSENVIALEGIVYPSPRITYLDLSPYVPDDTGFEVGGDGDADVGMIGGETDGAVGGGSYAETPQYMREFGDALYIHAGGYTFTVRPDQSTPDVVEGHYHGAAARARKSDVFADELVVALGPAQNMEIASSPYTAATPTAWKTAQVPRTVVTVGPGGRLFNSIANKVYNVLPSADATLSASYLPSNGEVITDPSNPVRALEEFTSALVAGTARGPRTLDPNRGYQGVPLTKENRLSASDYDGRGMIALGPVLLTATRRGVEMIIPGRTPVPAGPEVLHHNDTPYKGLDWGVPDFMGHQIAWPAYVPETGDSVIFFAKLREADDNGTGPVAWHDALFLDGRECRDVRFWGGTASVKPRLFFGAGTTANPSQVGWCDLGEDGGADPFTSDGQPATTGFIETPLDDLGLPGVNKNIERVEVPYAHGPDATNYVVVQGRAGHGGSLTNLVKAQTGSNQERINTEGFARVFAQTGSQMMAQDVAVRFTFTQAAGATADDWIVLHGSIVLYYTEVPDEVQAITTFVDAKTTDIEEAEAKAAVLRGLMGAGHKRQRFGPDGADRWVKVTGAQVKVAEVAGADGNKTDTRLAIELTMREVLTA